MDPKNDINEFLKSLNTGILKMYMYYGISDLVNQEVLIKEASKKELKVDFLKGELDGIIQVSFLAIPINLKNLSDFETSIRLKFKEPLTVSLRESNNSAKIEYFLKRTDYLRNFCKLITILNQRIKEGKEDVDSLKNYLYRYEKFLGPEGIELFIKILNENKEDKIVKSYSEYQDFILKKFQIEVFISQQLNQNYLTIISLANDLILSKGMYFYINIEGLKELIFSKLDWHHSFIEKRTEMYRCNENKNLIVIPLLAYRNKANDGLLWLRLLFQNINSGLYFMKYVLDREDEVLEEEYEQFPVRLEMIKNNIQNMSNEELTETQNLIVVFQNALTSQIIDIYNPIKKEFKQYYSKKDRMNRLIEDKALTQQLMSEGMVYAVKKLSPPANFGIELPSIVISSIYSSIVKREKKYSGLQESLREINKEIENLKHEKKLKEIEINEAKQREIAAKESKILGRLEFLIKVIRDLFSGKPPSS